MLREFLENYKELTEKMITAVISDDMNLFQNLLDCRQKVIYKLDNLNYSSVELRRIIRELKIIELEHELSNITLIKKEEYKCNINRIKLKQNAHNSYNKAFFNDSHFFKEKR